MIPEPHQPTHPIHPSTVFRNRVRHLIAKTCPTRVIVWEPQDKSEDAIGNPYNPDSPSYYQKLRNDLHKFHEAYVAYTNRAAGDIQAGGHAAHSAERSEVVRLSVAASRAVAVSGLQLAWLPPAAIANSTPPAEGLAAVALVHESRMYRGLSSMGPTSIETTVDAIGTADAILSIRQDELAARRRSPWYWGDRIVRAVLGFPGYFISVVFGFDRFTLSSAQGRTLWVLSVLADGAAVFGLGRTLGWW